jgi:hypothetical protein
MSWVREHSKLIGGVALTITILALSSLAYDKLATSSPTGSQGVWHGFESTQELQFDPTTPRERDAVVTEEDVFDSLVSDRIHTHLTTQTPKIFGLATLPTATSSYTFSQDDITALLANLTPSAAIAIPVMGEDEKGLTLSDVYAYLPQGLTSIAPSTKKLTGARLELYEYGNRAGSYIETFGEQYGNYQNATLRRFLEDRDDEMKIKEVDDLGKAFIQLGKELKTIEPVPAFIADTHIKMADGYIAVGEATRKVALAKTDDELLAAILNSNYASDTFVKAYVSIAEQFSALEVTFRDSEPGKVFVFTTLQ